DWSTVDWSTLDSARVSAFTGALAGYVKTYPSEFSAKAKAGYGLYYDCLKKLGRFAKAFDVLESQPALRSIAAHAGMLIELNTERGLKLFDADAEVQRLVKGFLRDLPTRVTAMLLAPERGFFAHQLTYGGAQQTLEDAVASVIRRAVRKTDTGENEL